MSDFPAAHSMDTYWFAIDANENVAVFNTGEAGALPDSTIKLMRGKQIADIESLIQYFPKDDQGITIVKTAGERAAQGATMKTLRNDIRSAFKSSYQLLGSRVYVLSSEKVIPKLEIESQLVFRFLGEPVVVYLSYCHASILEKLIESREILGSSKQVVLSLNGHLIGLFSYQHGEEWENWIPGPYRRKQQPEQPLKLEELPEDIQDLISWTWFEELHFQDTEMIQPIEHTKCRTWGGMGICQGWIDIQGERHE